MKTDKFKALSKKGLIKAGKTMGEVAVVGGSMLMTTKFLDFETLFKDKIAADPTFKDNFFIKHQGGVKFAAGCLLAASIKNPWVKLLGIGIAGAGFIQEARVLTQSADGSNFFKQIGNSAMDRKLLAAAQMNGPLSTRDQTFVAGEKPLSERNQTYVGEPVNLMNERITNVGFQYMERGVGQMERGTGCATSM